MYNPAINPPGLMESVYGPKARERAVNVMDVVSVSNFSGILPPFLVSLQIVISVINNSSVLG